VIRPRRAPRSWWVINIILIIQAAVILFEVSMIGGLIIFRSIR
jgi:hypothetical protein